ncbi:diaminopimelate epimerase [Corynebacterium choanae]|uniref:Diaminopimelate epimerase n=1 Tax=Corynebacterium choanae TaxID=1862358 RepID=A0A3G6JA48_9CORY|nr:diaminopimelate epimerase [Corynebacterium choanae]AZA13778.1 Diaminopimelate epimerase [Corynebacterium choanae]
MSTLPYALGHGTENDFVILLDADAEIDLTEDLVRALCDRRCGVGADGVLRAARAGALLAAGIIDEIPGDLSHDTWFMDYRNADGSIAGMCGNGVRVFAHFLLARGLESVRSFDVATRAGNRPVNIGECTDHFAEVTVDMGSPTVTGVSTCFLGQQEFAGLAIDAGNPHLACVVPGLDAAGLADLPVQQQFVVDETFFPDGVNVEIATTLNADGEMHMRVHERGAGETRACGTGTVAIAMAALADQGKTHGKVTVHEPGGTLQVTIYPNGRAELTGPSVLYAAGLVKTEALTVLQR